MPMLYVILGLLGMMILFGFVSAKLSAKGQKTINDMSDCYAYHDGSLTLLKCDERFGTICKIERKTLSTLHYVPEKYVYTGATVGGITTGGVHKEGGYNEATPISEKRYELKIKVYDESSHQMVYLPIDSIHVADKSLLEAAKANPRISDYISGSFIWLNDSNALPDNFTSIAHRLSPNDFHNAIMLHEIQNYPTYTKCLDILNFICGSPNKIKPGVMFGFPAFITIFVALTALIFSLAAKSVNWLFIISLSVGIGLVVFLFIFIISIIPDRN
ncbi:MAG: hypothetical protein IKU84_03200 [Clostridia bacterium]|nr:hypothetical protein [Clostridia bacterium]